MNGFTIANRKQYQQRLVLRALWEANEHRLFVEDKQKGFSGTIEEWKSVENFRRLQNIIGHCPFTPKMMKDRGWNINLVKSNS